MITIARLLSDTQGQSDAILSGLLQATLSDIKSSCISVF